MQNSNDKILHLIHKLIPHTYPYQDQIILCDNPELIINKSRQIGISYLIAARALLKSIFEEKTELIISPSLRQSKHMMDYIYQHINHLKEGCDDIQFREETKTSIIFQTGGEIHSLPNSANTIRGFTASDIYVDEFAHFTNGTDKEIIESLAPSRSRGGNIWYISTPFGNQNLFYKYWVGRNNINKMLINYKECPDLKPEIINQMKEILGEDGFQQEFNNQFLSDMENQEFPMELITSCIDSELDYQEPEKNHVYLGGADIGRKQDQTAFIIIEKTPDGKYIIRNKQIMRNTPYEQQMNMFTFYLDNYHFSKFHIDESGIGNMIAEQLHYGHHITPVTFNNENKQTMVSNLKRLMQEKKLLLVDDPQIINNLRSIKRKYTNTNYLQFDSDRNSEIGHADLFWALCLCLYDESKNHDVVLPISTNWAR